MLCFALFRRVHTEAQAEAEAETQRDTLVWHNIIPLAIAQRHATLLKLLYAVGAEKHMMMKSTYTQSTLGG